MAPILPFASARGRRFRRALVPVAVVLLTAAGCYNPRGSFDAAAGVSTDPTGVWVAGWVDDQDAAGASEVLITVDNVLRVHQPANHDRHDVAALVGGAKLRSGFNFFVPTGFGGHQVCVWAGNTGGDEPHTFLGCRSAVVGRGASTSYSFIVPPVGGTPVRWNACNVVHYTTRTSTVSSTYPEARLDIQAALAQVSSQTGLRFVDDGEVAAVPSRSYGSDTTYGYQPLLIGWVRAAESDLFTGQPASVVGVAGSWYTGGTFVTGRVALEQDRLASRPRTGPHSKMTVLLHELGHAVGLGHIDDDTQLMNPWVVNYGDWGAGDMTGLRALATPGCPATLGPAPREVGELQAGPIVAN
jgi:hypothetical protein